jgi:hypothetical protein
LEILGTSLARQLTRRKHAKQQVVMRVGRYSSD